LLLPLRATQPPGRFPAATAWLIAANGLVLVMTAVAGRELLLRAGAIPFEVIGLRDLPPAALVPPPFTVLTSLFVHTGFVHLLGNMWFLWVFGNAVEQRLGGGRLVAFYLLAGVVGALAQCLLMPASTVPMVGASGAVAGVLGGAVLILGREPILGFTVIGFVSVPAWVFLGLWFAAQLLLGDQSGVAWMAHVGGFLAGLGSIRLFLPGGRGRARPIGP